MTNDIYNRGWATPTVKPSPINSRGYAVRRTYGFGYAARRTYGFGYAVRRTYGNRTTVNGMHAEGVPQQRRWATPSGSMSVGMRPVSVGRTDPRLLIGDRVAVIYADNIGTDIGDRFAVICPETFPTTQHHK